MYTLKGFISVDGLANASPTSIAPIGQLSQLGMTFARGVGEYSSQPQPYNLHCFSSNTASGQTTVPPTLLTQIFAIVAWAFQLQQSGAPATSSTAFNTSMTSQYGAAVGSIGCGNMVDNGTFLFPEFITWVNPTLVTNDPATGGLVTLWFSDTSFQKEYDEYTIVVVPPLPTIDTFMSGATAVQSALASYTSSSLLNAIQSARSTYPETELVPQTYDYVDPSNSANQITTTWACLIYGAAGNNVDAIRAAVQAYIAANSQYPVASWEAIFPEIYTSTEFLMIPRWADYAIPNLVLTQGGYSSIVNLQKQLTYLAQILPDFSSAYLLAHAAVIPSNYKSVEMLVVPGLQNATAEQDLINVFPDLMNVPTSDTLYNLMSTKTRGWIGMILQMLITAEQANVQSTLPAGMSTATRDGVLYVAQEYAGITYLLATKGTLPAYNS